MTIPNPHERSQELTRPSEQESTIKEVAESSHSTASQIVAPSLAGFPNAAALSFLSATETREIIRWNGAFYWYEEGQYVHVTDDTIKVAVTAYLSRHLRTRKNPKSWVEESLKESFVRDVFLCVKAATAAPSNLEPGQWIKPPQFEVAGPVIATAGGIVDLGRLDSRQFVLPPTPNLFAHTALPVCPDPAARCDCWLQFIGQTFDGSQPTAAVLQEAFGYSLLGNCRFEKFFLLFGEGRTGKSTVVETWHSMLGASNISSVPLEQFNHRFSLSAMVGKSANIVFDSAEIAQAAEGILKTIVSGEPLLIEQKHKDATTQRLSTKLIFVTNVLPTFHDVSSGLWRRMQLIPFTHEVPEIRRNPNLKATLRSELPGILNWSLQGLARLWRQGGFTPDPQADQALEQYRRDCNPVAVFVDEECVVDVNARVGRKMIYQRFRSWSMENGFRPESSTKFYRKIGRLVPQPANPPRNGRGGDRMLVGVRLRANDLSSQFADLLANRGRN